MTRVLVMTRYDRQGASSRLRLLDYLPLLEEQGFSFEVHHLLDRSYLERRYAGAGSDIVALASSYARRCRALAKAKNFDLLWFDKELFPWLPYAFEQRFLSQDLPYVVDIDDAVYLRYDQHRNPLLRRIMRGKLQKIMAGSALVVAGNQVLAQEASEAGAPSIEVLPTVLAPQRYRTDRGTVGLPLRVVWMGSPFNTRYLLPIAKTLRKLQSEGLIQPVLIGGSAELLREEAPGLEVEQHSWSEEGEGAALAACDLGIMPLPDTPFERGKCGYKLIQYMAAGLPVIASPVGVNREIVTPEVGVLAEKAEDWAAAIRRLAKAPDLARQMGQAGREKVEASFDITKTAVRYGQLLCEAAKR